MRTYAISPIIFIGCALVFAAACAGAGQSFERVSVPGDQAVIYIYRMESDCLSDRVPEVLIDDKKIGSLKNGGYVVARVEAKVHTVKINTGDHMDVGEYVDPAPGEERFVKWIPACQVRAGTTTHMATMGEMEQDEALPEISTTRSSQ